MRCFRTLIVMVTVLLVAGCAVDNAKYSATLQKANPNNILVLPVLNETEVEAASLHMLSTVTKPLIERGYLVVPVNSVQGALEKGGFTDTAVIYKTPTAEIAKKFDADAVLYMTVRKWTKTENLLSTVLTSNVNYVLKDGRSGAVLWETYVETEYSTNSGGLFALPIDDLIHIGTAIAGRGEPDYTPLAKQTHNMAFYMPNTGLPKR